MKKYRILMVLGNTGRGGSQAYAMNILRNINRDIFCIDFAVYEDSDNGFGHEMRELGASVIIVPEFKIYNYYVCRRIWKKILSNGNYNVIHAHATNAAFLFLEIAQKMGIQTIAHSHNSNYRGNFLQQRIKRFFSDKCRKYANYWFSCSELASYRLFYDEYKTFPKYYEIPNAIIVSRYMFSIDVRNRIRNFLGINDQELLIGHVGSFSMPKNHKFLLEIFKNILSKKPSSKLLLCGDGPLKNQVENYISVMGLSNSVIRVGNVPNVWEFMMAMDVFLFPSFFEGFPVTLIEAQASGLPIVMTDTITKESHLTDLITSLSLNDSLDVWSDVVIDKRTNDRVFYNNIVAKTKFNMQNSIEEISKLYIGMIENR